MARSLDRSNSSLSTPELYRDSATFFTGITTQDVEELWQEHGFGSLEAAMTAAEEQVGRVDESVRILAEKGFRQICKVVQDVFVASRFTGTIEERIATATHAYSVATLGVLAARREDRMDEMIGRIERDEGDTVYLAASRENFEMSHGTHGAASLSTEARCPFAGLYLNGEVVQPAAPIFADFARWSAELAVYYDDPSYRKRHGLA